MFYENLIALNPLNRDPNLRGKVPFTDMPEDTDSYKNNEGYKGKWRELYGAWGLVRRHPELILDGLVLQVLHLNDVAL